MNVWSAALQTFSPLAAGCGGGAVAAGCGGAGAGSPSGGAGCG